MKNLIYKTLFTAAALVLIANAAFSADVNPGSADTEAFFPDFYQDTDLKTAAAEHKPYELEWGGWLTPTYIDNRGDGSTLSMSSNTLRVWANMSLWKNASVYVRARNMFNYTIDSSASSSSADEVTYNGPYISVAGRDYSNMTDLDMAYFSASSADKKIAFQGGRKFFTLGHGLLLSGRGDGADIQIYSNILDIKAVSFYTGLIPTELNSFNKTGQDYTDGAERLFGGLSLGKDFGNNKIYLLAMTQYDLADTDAYSCHYGGLGAKGAAFGSMEYYSEVIYQYGTKKSGTAETTVSAYAGIAGANYYFKKPFKPSLQFQYAYGSGDDPADKTDSGFDYFGSFWGGSALRPELQNIHIFRAGFSFAPADKSANARLNRMTVQGRYNYYLKDKNNTDAGGGIGANENDGSIGHGFDLSLTWAVYSDLAFFASYGLFLPGDAFASTETAKGAFVTGLNFNF